MFTLIKNADVYAPEHLGKKSVLVCGERIAWVGDDFPAEKNLPGLKAVDAKGMMLMPGIIDNHVHVTGGGSEGGPHMRTPELLLSDMVKGGVTTVIGVRGTDDVSRSMEALVAKTNGLIAEGVSAWCLTGSYQLPVKSLCGGIREDIVLIDKVIGVGEIALSDHRSSNPTFEEFMYVAAAARVGGMLAGKSGLVNVHLGDGPGGIEYLFRAGTETEVPISQFVPTHMNRNPDLFEQAREFAKIGGYVDFTTSTTQQFLDEGEVKCSKALKILLEDGVPASRISFSSDGQGSMPVFDAKGNFAGMTIGRVTSIAGEFKDAIVQEKVLIEDAVRVVSTTSADHFKLPRKGYIKEGFDADIVLLDEKLDVQFVFSRGRKMMENGRVLVKGTFED
ncbi:beta-aspartyl-peptidase [Synergistaceae bacterium OttesenSCG-928-D05]|nr:beta-aspartyl-peptidase [Synergistaceae bacterium OttesenSCG-928-D05]